MLQFCRVLASRLRAWRAMPGIERQFDEELDTHLALLTEEYLRRGMSPEEARRAARVRLGGTTQLRESHRELRGLPAIETLARDIRYACRALRRAPGFTLVATLTLALGVGANTAIFSVVDAVLLRPLPYAHPDELVTWRGNESLMDVDDIRAQAGFFSAGGAINVTVMDYTSGTEPVGVHAGYVDAGFFQVLGVPAKFGRTPAPEEDRRGAPRVAVLSFSFWRNVLSGDPHVLGKAIGLSGNHYTIIGVMPEEFAPPENSAEVYVPLRTAYPEASAYRGVHFMQSYWRLKSGVTPAAAAAGMAPIDARLGADHPAEDRDRHRVPVPLQQWVTGDVRPALWILFAAVSVVLLIACANFAGLLMARGLARRREMVVRAALGGGRGRLLREALTESLLLGALGGAAGLLLAYLGVRLLVAARPAALAHLNGIAVDPRVLALGLALAGAAGLIFGFAPAWSASRPDMADTLKRGGRGSGAEWSRHGFRHLLVIGEMALALILLAGAGLLVKGFALLRSVDPGFNPSHVMAIDIQLPAARYNEIPQQIRYRREMLGKLNALGGVHAAAVGDAPMNGGQLTHSLAIEGRPPVPEGREPMVDTLCVMGDYFRVMQIPVHAGRAPDDTDREHQPLVAAINEALARRYFAGENPIGHRIRWARETGPPLWMTIVGVVADIRQYSLEQPAFPAVYTPFAQSDEAWRRWMSVVVRLPESAEGLVPAIKREIWSLDAQIPLDRLRSMDDWLQRSFAERRFNMSLLSLFAGLATALAGVGLYGLMAYQVGRRTREIGIRVAVGARGADILKLVMGQGARLAAVGLAAGLAGALALTRLMTSLLFGVKPTDGTTLAAVVALMAALVLLACYVPARRAMRVDPTVALRDE